MIMTIDARHVQRHQMQVVDCLRSPDDTLKRKACPYYCQDFSCFLFFVFVFFILCANYNVPGDGTVQTLDLLFKMTNPMNVEMITQKLVDHLASTSDFYLRTELVSRITQLAERSVSAPPSFPNLFLFTFIYVSSLT
jgi:hypothetical protein